MACVPLKAKPSAETIGELLHQLVGQTAQPAKNSIRLLVIQDFGS